MLTDFKSSYDIINILLNYMQIIECIIGCIIECIIE